jgi:23S rRNA (uracil1939-C5)-methyltransferase
MPNKIVQVKSDPFELTVTKLVYGGDGLGRHNGKVVLVPFAVPGDRLLVSTVKEKKNFIRAEIVRVLEPGPGRVTPECAHFQHCGGCQWQQLEYPRQVEAKRQILQELFHHRFPATRDLEITMKPSPQANQYRSRARVQLRIGGPEPVIGFYRHESHQVVDVWACPLLKPGMNSWFKWIRDHYQEDPELPDETQMEITEDEYGGWTSMPMESGQEDSYNVLFNKRSGNGPESEKQVGEFTYRVSPSAFFQANDFLAEELLNSVMDLSGASPEGAALDLYSGVGLFTLPLAHRFGKVTAVESSPVSCALASANVAAARLQNVRVVHAKVAEWMLSAGSVAAPTFETIVLDPPRSGAGQVVMDKIREWVPETVVYVSCDPQTLVRDLSVIPSSEFEIRCVQGLDLFPQTFHFETIVLLKRR